MSDMDELKMGFKISLGVLCLIILCVAAGWVGHCNEEINGQQQQLIEMDNRLNALRYEVHDLQDEARRLRLNEASKR